MPIVTVDPAEFERHELSTAPADPNDPNDSPGFVMIRPLPFGMKLTRSDKATKMFMRSQTGGSKGQNQDATIEMETLNEWATQFDFAYCIGEHNLQAKDGTLLNFSNKMHVMALDPRVGTEIQQILDKINNADDEETIEDFLKRQNTLSSVKEESSVEDGSVQLEAPTPMVTKS